MCMNKPKVDKQYYNKRLSGANLENYLKDTYGELKIKSYKQIPNVKPFLQKDYGGEGDCTLTSILTTTGFYRCELNMNDVYNYIEKVAKKYLYHPNIGTNPFFNKNIVKEVFKYFKIQNPVSSKLIKGIGFNAYTIINEIKNAHPVILSITNDGRSYYKNHTITIVGYNIYEDKNGKEIIIFRVFDN